MTGRPAAAGSATLDSGVRLSYATQGPAADRDPPLLMLPGTIDSWRSYAPVLAALPPSVAAVAMSPRGHGDSDRPSTGYAVDDLGRDALALLDHLGIGRSVVVAHSGSCLVARWLAIHHPDRVAGLVLEASPTTLGGYPVFEDFVAAFVAGLCDPIDPEVAAAFVSETAAPTVAVPVLDQAVADARLVPAHVWHGLFAGLGDYDDTERLRSIEAPVLLVWGDRDELVGRDMQDRLLAALPRAELVVYPGRSHTPRWEEPARFAADVAAFARRAAGS